MSPGEQTRATANYRPVCIPDSSHLSRLAVLVLAEREGPERKRQDLGAASYMYDGQSQRSISQQQRDGHPLPIAQPPGFLEFCLHPGLPASCIWLGRRAAFDIFHVAYMSVNKLAGLAYSGR